MRLIAVSPALLVAACASNPTDNTQPVDRACSVADCFSQREVRDFEVIGDTTLIMYVGGQRCAFQVELDGALCDMTFAPDVFFRSPEGRPEVDRVCSYDRQIGVDGGPFTETFDSERDGRLLREGIDREPIERFGRVNSQCRILSVASITDDELVELYVKRGVVPPPPPIGPGEIRVGDEAPAEEPETTQPAEDETAEAEAAGAEAPDQPAANAGRLAD
jgi:hypothetical protein